MTQPSRPVPHAIDAAREGMVVLDSAAENVGTVEMVKMGDPEAVTTQGQQPPAGAEPIPAPVGVPGGAGTPGMPGAVPSSIADTEPKAPPSLAERLLRAGYLKIDSKGAFRRDLYVAADQVERVDNDTVYLNVDRDELVTTT